MPNGSLKRANGCAVRSNGWLKPLTGREKNLTDEVEELVKCLHAGYEVLCVL